MKYLLKRRLYEALPVCLRAPFAWVPFGLVAGAPYRSVAEHGRYLDHANRSTIQAYKEEALGNLLRFVTAQVPAYARFAPIVARLSPLEALKSFPLLDKKTLQQDINMYLPRCFEHIPHYETTTGGTSGCQLRFFLDDSSQSVEMAFMHRMWARIGYTPRCRKATFRGVPLPRVSRGVYWQLNPVYNELQFSPCHMNAGTLGLYVKELLRYQPDFLHGYPSAISILAQYLLREGIDVRRLHLRGVLLASEPLLPGQRALIEQAFHARPFSWYGHSERIVLGGECERSVAYHHFPDYGVLEIVDANGDPVPEDGMGELVGTGLCNRSLPLVRYRTGDRARRLPYACTCGRCFDRFGDVEGRWQQEYVIGANSSKISLAALNIHGSAMNNVMRYQYYQDTPGVMEIRIIPLDSFGERDIISIQNAFAAKTGDELVVRIKIVDDIPLTMRGKLRRLVQEIPSVGNLTDA